MKSKVSRRTVRFLIGVKNTLMADCIAPYNKFLVTVGKEPKNIPCNSIENLFTEMEI